MALDVGSKGAEAGLQAGDTFKNLRVLLSLGPVSAPWPTWESWEQRLDAWNDFLLGMNSSLLQHSDQMLQGHSQPPQKLLSQALPSPTQGASISSLLFLSTVGPPGAEC